MIVAAGRLEMGGQLAHWWPHLGRPLAELGTKFAAQFRDKRERERDTEEERAGAELAARLLSPWSVLTFGPFGASILSILSFLSFLRRGGGGICAQLAAAGGPTTSAGPQLAQVDL